MSNSNIGLLIVIAVALFQLSACSYVKSLFPDKEKDYQFTTEIAPLVIPPDLSANPAFKRSVADSAPVTEAEHADSVQANLIPETETSVESEPQVAELAPDNPGQSDEASAAAPVQQSSEQQARKSELIPIELVIYDDGESRLRIGADIGTSWRMVGKALTRRSMEVISRNQEEASFEVLYDPDEQQFEDDSWWDEIKFVFRGFKANEEQYTLKLIGHNQQTDVAVIDQDGKPAMNGAGLSLLKLIHKTLKADQAD